MGISEFGGMAFAETILKHSGLYSIYERRLGSRILKDPLPNHIAIILDGNRRWSKYHFAGIYSGHSIGADKAEELLNWIHDLG
ncbi:MAG: undecaprenyl diphosphate synthase family protein, partial [Nitrososphaeraceae archaeon]|nr:undecaprenyl diphosphate synthase family protein [Nitrososphaeraceae archaeon]